MLGNGADTGASNISRATVLGFIKEMDEVESELAEALAACKAPRKKVRAIRKRMEDAGINQAAFDAMRRDAEKPGSVRQEEHRQYLMMMQYIGKPANFQGSFVFEDSEEDIAAASQHQKDQVRAGGLAAGKGGGGRGENPWVPGTELYSVWDEAWSEGNEVFMEGQREIAQSMAPDAPKTPGRRGRPPGSKNKSKTGAAAAGDSAKL